MCISENKVLSVCNARGTQLYQAHAKTLHSIFARSLRQVSLT